MAQKYSIHINKLERKVEIAVCGVMEERDAYAFLDEYIEKTSAIKTSKYMLELDSTEMDYLDDIPSQLLKEAYQLYKESDFEKIILIMKLLGNTMLNMQIMQLARESEFTQFEVQMV
ncbi:hypothetical protein [Bacillus sp. 1P06AnD]|uniref:hypothetical protein n=1 Tax=Bacillus sp. 1P06AnD TaxID=3132208 RepID=UPI00399F2928